jgi:hypothetical protein
MQINMCIYYNKGASDGLPRGIAENYVRNLSISPSWKSVTSVVTDAKPGDYRLEFNIFSAVAPITLFTIPGCPKEIE